MAKIDAPATADMISYLDVINGLGNQLKSTMPPADYAKFVTTHNALSAAVLSGAAVADLTPYISGSLTITPPPDTNATKTP